MAYSKNRRLAEIISDTSGNLSVQGLTVPTQSASDNDTSAASTAYVTTAVSGLIDSAPDTLNTLNEIAAALNDDANFNTTVTNSIAAKLPLAGGSLTGGLDITASGDNLKLKRSNFDDILLGIGTGNSQSGIHITNTTDSVTIASIHENAPASSLVMDSSGNIGIGTSSPDTPLQVNGSPQMLLHLNRATSTPGIKFTNGGSASGTYGYMIADENEFGFGYYDGTSSSTKVLFDGSGNVGIGETSPARALDVVSSADYQLQLSNGSSAGHYELGRNNTTGAFHFYGNQSGDIAYVFDGADGERMRINSTGEVHITSAGAAISPTIKYGGATGDVSKLRLINRSGQSANKGGAVELGGVTDDGVSRSDVFAALHGGKDNSTSGNRAGYLDFHTSNGTALDQRMRLTSNGELLIGDTSLRGTNQRGQLQVTQISSSNAAGISAISGNDEIAGTFCLYSSSTASAMISVDPDSQRASSAFYVWIDGSEKMTLNSSGNLYVTGSYSNSDRALKENISPLPTQLEKVKQLNPVSFDWVERAEDGSTQSSIGFVAQEVEELYPNLVTKPEEDTDAEQGSRTKYKTLNYPVMVSILTKAIQEQQTIIDDLKSRIETLEG